jgi:hypothetical protein
MRRRARHRGPCSCGFHPHTVGTSVLSLFIRPGHFETVLAAHRLIDIEDLEADADRPTNGQERLEAILVKVRSGEQGGCGDRSSCSSCFSHALTVDADARWMLTGYGRMCSLASPLPQAAQSSVRCSWLDATFTVPETFASTILQATSISDFAAL